MQERQIMNQEDVRRALTRVAHEILEHNRGAEDLVIVGIHTGGVHLARRIAASLREFEGIDVPVATLDVSLYRDDLGVRTQAQTKLQQTDIPSGIQGKSVVLVDDVLYTGRTIRAAMDALYSWGRPRRVMLLVMVDRGHRELPIQPDFCGKKVLTSKNENISVRLNNVDNEEGVFLE